MDNLNTELQAEVEKEDGLVINVTTNLSEQTENSMIRWIEQNPKEFDKLICDAFKSVFHNPIQATA